MKASYRVSTHLTEELLAEAVARAEKVACSPGDHRCSRFPDRQKDTRTSCTPTGPCRIEWILANRGRDA